LKQFTTAYENFGIHIRDDNSVVAKEWAPGAQEIFLTGDFSMHYFFYNCINILLNQDYFYTHTHTHTHVCVCVCKIRVIVLLYR